MKENGSMNKKKLCIFITRFIAGGAQKVVVELLSFLDRDKFDIVLIFGRTPKDEPNLLGYIPEDVETICMDNVVREINPRLDFVAFRELLSIFRKRKFDILHLHTSKAGVLGSIAGKYARVPKIVYTPHGHIFHKEAAIPGVSGLSDLKMKLLYWLRRYAYSCCDALVALSEEDKSEQVALKLARAEKFIVIMNGINVDCFAARDEKLKNEAAKKLGLAGYFVIGSIGRLSKEKGHDVLIRAFAMLGSSLENARLLIVGEGDERERLCHLAGELGVSGRVVFAGNIEDVRPLLWLMDVFVLPSRYESQGIAAMEAMSAGMPVLASNVGGVPGIITDKEEGLLVVPDSPRAFADALTQLRDDGKMREALGRNARARAEKSFRVENMISEHENLYEGTGK